MKNFKYLLIGLPLTFMASCSSDDNTIEEEPKEYPIIVTATENPLGSTEGAKKGIKRAPIVTTTSLNQFYLFYGGYFNGGENIEYDESIGTFTKQGTQWGSILQWPPEYTGTNDNKVLNFYAFNAGESISGDYGEACIAVLVDQQTSDRQVDLLAAKNSVSYLSGNGVVPLTFDHISAAVQVKLRKTESISGYTVNVSEVILHNIKYNGEYYFDRDTVWNLDDNLTNYTIFAADQSGSLEVSTNYQLLAGEGDYLFLLPQKLTGWNKSAPLKDCYIEINCKIFNSDGYKVGSANEYKSVYLPLDATIKMGMINALNISMGTALRNSDGTKIFQ